MHIAHSNHPDAVLAVRRLRRRRRWLIVSVMVTVPLFALMLWEPPSIPRSTMNTLVFIMFAGLLSGFLAAVRLEKRQKEVKECVDKGEAVKTSWVIHQEYLSAVTAVNANPSVDEFFTYVRERRKMLKELQVRVIHHSARKKEGADE